MPKALRKAAARVERRATEQVALIRRVVHEYSEAARSGKPEIRVRLRKQREIERAVGDYMRLQKSLRRLKKKMRAAK